MEGSSSQSGSTSSKKSIILTAVLDSNSNFENKVLLKLEEDGFTTLDDKVEELLILFESIQIKFSSRTMTDSLKALANPSPFDHYSKESVAILELHLRTWMAVLKRICFSSIHFSRELRENIYNSLAKFAEIYRKTTQVIEEGLEDNFKSNLNINQQKNDNENYIKKRNYNIDFLLIHIRDTFT